MKRFHVFFLVLFFTPALRAQTPTLVQFTNDSLQNNAAIATWTKTLPNPTQPGNLLVIACTWGSGSATGSMTDNQGNIWTSGPLAQSASLGQTLQIFYAPNVAASTQSVTLTLSSPASSVQCTPHEFFNVSPVGPADGSSASVINSGTTLAAGDLTTSAAGDLIFYAGMCAQCGNPNSPLAWTAGSGFSPTVADGTSFFGAEYQVQTTAGTINPEMMLNSPTTGGLAAAIAFKSASAGNPPPSGIHVNSVQILTYPLATNWAGTTISFQIPTTGNLIVVASESLTGANVTSISSNPANVWNSTGSCANNSVNATSVCIWYAANATPSTEMTITLNYSENPVVGPIDGFWDISGASASPFDVAATATGNLGSETGTVSAPTLTPTAANGLVIALMEQDGQTVGSASPGSLLTVQAGAYQYLGLDQDGGWLNYYNPNTNPITFEWTYVNDEGSHVVGNWEVMAAAFQAGAPTEGSNPNAPSITSLSPGSGVVGTLVTITGTNLGSTQGTSTVTFNGTPATPTSWSATSIVVPVPSGASSGNVTVTVGDQASNGLVFTVTTPAPAITAISPNSGPAGTSVTITGANFGSTQGASTVTFNGTAATPTSWSATSIVAPVPIGATTGSVVVTVAGQASNTILFTVMLPLSPNSAGDPSQVQQASNSDVSGKTYTSFSATFGSTTTTGNAIIIGITYGNANPAITATDSDGNTYQVAINTYDTRHDQGSAILYALNINGGIANKVTVNFGTSVAYLGMGIHEYSGLASASALDVTSGSTGTGTSLTSGTVVTRNSGDLIFGCAVEDSKGSGDTFTPGSGFTLLVNLGSAAAYADEGMTQATTGSVAATWKLTQTKRDWIAVMAAFVAQ